MSDMQDERKVLEMPAVDERRPRDQVLPLGMMDIGMVARFRLLNAMAPAARSGSVSR